MLRTFGFLLLSLPFLGGCESSIRLPPLGSPFGQSSAPVSQPIASAPAPQVQSAPLAPPVAQQDLPPPAGAQAAQAPRYEPLPDAGQPPGADQNAPTPFGEPPKQAKLEPARQQARTTPAAEEPAVAPTRTSVTGNWKAQEASGGSCKLTLSSTPKLDLYNAGTSGCQSKELQRVTAWELRGDEVYLYESGGAVAARLRSGAGQRFNGALAKTGAPVTLSK